MTIQEKIAKAMHATHFPKKKRGSQLNDKPLLLIEALWCRGTESNCRHGVFRLMTAFFRNSKVAITYCLN